MKKGTGKSTLAIELHELILKIKRKRKIKSIIRLIIHSICGSTSGYLFLLLSLIIIKYSVGFQVLSNVNIFSQGYWLFSFYMLGAVIYLNFVRLKI